MRRQVFAARTSHFAFGRRRPHPLCFGDQFGSAEYGLNGDLSPFFTRMALSDPKLLFWNGKIPQKSIHFVPLGDKDRAEQPSPPPATPPSLCGVPLKYISYVFIICLFSFNSS
jgi:hypothetical protein